MKFIGEGFRSTITTTRTTEGIFEGFFNPRTFNRLLLISVYWKIGDFTRAFRVLRVYCRFIRPRSSQVRFDQIKVGGRLFAI